MFTSDLTNAFVPHFIPYYSLDSDLHKQCLQDASYITPAHDLSIDNLVRATIDTKSRSILATPIDNFNKSKSTVHNQYHQVDLILQLLHHCASFHVEVNACIIIPLIDPIASSLSVNIWEWRPSLQKALRSVTDVQIQNKFNPWRPTFDAHSSTYGTERAPYHHSSGVMILYMNNKSEYSRVPPPVSNDLVTNKLVESISKLKVSNNKVPSMEFIRVDVSKEFLAGNTEAAHRFFNGIFDAPTNPETGSVVPQTAIFKEGTIKRRTGPLWENFWRFDIEFSASGSLEIMNELQKKFSLSAETPELIMFPVSKSVTNGSYVISLKRGNPKEKAPQKPPLELLHSLMKIESFDDIVHYAMVRTNFSLIVHFDMNKVPFENFLDKVPWLSNQTKDAGMMLCEPDGSIARGRDFYQNITKP